MGKIEKVFEAYAKKGKTVENPEMNPLIQLLAWFTVVGAYGTIAAVLWEYLP